MRNVVVVKIVGRLIFVWLSAVLRRGGGMPCDVLAREMALGIGMPSVVHLPSSVSAREPLVPSMGRNGGKRPKGRGEGPWGRVFAPFEPSG